MLTMAKELTLEEALAQIKVLQEENAGLQEKLAAKESEVSKLNNEVPGTFIDNKTKKVYKFKKGFLQFKRNGKQLISEEVIKDAKLMKDLVEDGFGGIEEVKSDK
jgi:hypothetical protein